MKMTVRDLIKDLLDYKLDDKVVVRGTVRTKCGDFDYGSMDDVETGRDDDGNVFIEGFE